MLSATSQSQRLHTVLFHLHNILEITKLQKWRTNSWLPGVKNVVEWGGGREVGVALMSSMSLVMIQVLCLEVVATQS